VYGRKQRCRAGARRGPGTATHPPLPPPPPLPVALRAPPSPPPQHLLSFATAPATDVRELALFFNEPGAPILISTASSAAPGGVPAPGGRPFAVELVVATLDTSMPPAPGSPLTQMAARAFPGGPAPVAFEPTAVPLAAGAGAGGGE
jgi:hypothetical protein